MADKITVYDWTGEWRPPKEGEWIMGATGQPIEVGNDFLETEPCWILSPRQKGATKDE